MKRSIVLFMVPFIICTYIFLVIFGKACGDFGMDVQAKRGIPFNHKTHVQVQKYDCDTCHGYYENGRFIGIPTVGTCKNCHAPNSETKSVAMRLPYLEMYKDNEKAWSSYATQPPLVYFSHKVVMGSKYQDGGNKIACGSCHGDMANNTDGARIKGRMGMGVCEDCHDAINVSNKCAVCHD
ncbi:MAG: cytochrome c3 family protein [Spirochaetes bacterium]|nr:cytochrome c3 family protein [Spirochaetota bacterium]